jgi:hypothetical protein
MTGGLCYLPEKIFLSEFKYFAQLYLGMWGWGGGVDWPRVRPQRNRTVKENSGYKGD